MTRTTSPSPAHPSPGRPSPAPVATPRGGSYARLPRLAGPWFLPVAFLARLPFSMLTIATLLLVTEATGSVGSGGLASAAAALGTAVGGPVQGALADRVGQRRVVGACVPVSALSVAALLATTTGTDLPAMLASAALVGASVPQVSPLARVRWLALAADEPRTLRAATSYESTADELGFVLGPALVGILAAAGSPRTAVLVAAALVVTAGTAFALHPTARLASARPGGPTTDRGPRAVVRLARAQAVTVVGMLAMGLLFGGTQAALTGFTRDVGAPGLAGLVYAVMGVGSAVTALSVVALPDRWSPADRWTGFAAGLLLSAGALVGAAASGSLAAVVVAVAVLGLFVGPVMVTVFSVAGDRAAAGRTAAAMTLVASANVVGVALGATTAGQLAEAGSTTAAFLLPVVAGVVLLAAGVSLTSRPRAGLRRGAATSAAVR
ncbi:MFS transporter [Cellulosimicrobium marinum]|uniref:MFS transporter n=1 Tax=Cellulosimicrobium marinum TaxID=1638992 RepID=UPI001E507196|nr:MFS transporter [Cellulosimicrobium marinum]MCB7135480.1 MFS transporter [Cellulosimicrobium marinum]